jgi:hypothetical protein
VRKLQEQHALTLLTRETPIGINANVAYALQQCSGEFIAIADQDDIWDDRKIACLIDAIGDNDAVFSDSSLIDEHGNTLNATLRETYLKGCRPSIGKRPWRVLIKNSVSGHALLIRRSLLAIALPFSEKVLYDHQLAIASAMRHGIGYIDIPLVQHRLHRDNNNNAFDTATRRRPSRKRQQRHKAERFYSVLGSAEEIIGRQQVPSASSQQMLQLANNIRQTTFGAKFFIIATLISQSGDLFCLYKGIRRWRLAIRLGRALIRNREKLMAN